MMFRTESMVGAETVSTLIPPQYFPIEKRGRLFSISDVHGCLSHLEALIKKIEPRPEDTIVFLGDYVDRGEDSKGVIDFIISLRSVCNVITLVGNHDLMMLDSFLSEDLTEKHTASVMWLRNGGHKTLESYGLDSSVIYSDDLPQDILDHLDFIKGLSWWYETEDYIFVHATPRPEEHISEQPKEVLVWRRPSREDAFARHISGKTVVCGHTAQSTGAPSWLSSYYLLTDTGCFFTGVLTAVEFLDGGGIDILSVDSLELNGN